MSDANSDNGRRSADAGQKPAPPRRSGRKWESEDAGGRSFRRIRVLARRYRMATWLIVWLALPTLAAAGWYAWRALMAVQTLQVAVLKDTPDAKVMAALQKLLPTTNERVRIDVKTFEKSKDIFDAFQNKRVDLAILRTDEPFPTNAQSAAVMREVMIVYVALKADDVDDLRNVADKPMGVLAAEPVDSDLAQRVARNVDSGAKEPAVYKTSAEAAQALKDKKIASLAIATSPDNIFLRKAMREIIKVAGPKLEFLAVADSTGIAASNPGLDEVKLEAKAGSVKPALPSEELKTLKTQYRLIARADLDRSYVARITEALFTNRIALAKDAPSVNQIKTIDSDYVTSALFPAHLGALDYFRREQMSFYERYNDIIWLVILYGGSLLSGALWLGESMFKRQRETQVNLLHSVVSVVEDVRHAQSADEVDEHARKLEDIVCHALELTSAGKLSESKLAAILLGHAAARDSINDWRSGRASVAPDSKQQSSF